MRVEVDLPTVAARTLVDAERRWGLTRERTLAVLIVAGEAELSPGYVERVLETVYGRPT